MTTGVSLAAGAPSFQTRPQARFAGKPVFARRFGDDASPQQPPKRRKLNLLQKAGLTIAALGCALSLGLSAKANIDYDGKFNLIPATAEEKHQQGVASIPGILVLGLGGLMATIGKELRRRPEEDDENAPKA